MNSFRLKSYLTFLERNKLFTLINLFGFTVSLAVVILLGLYLRDEQRVDRFHKDHERIWRLSTDKWYCFAGPIAGDIKNRYPEVEAITRIGPDWESMLTEKQGTLMLPKTMYVDSSFFDIFSFPFSEGDPANQLRTMQEVTLTRSYATQLFGAESAIGKSLKLYGNYDTLECVVTGVVEDFRNTHFSNPDLIVRFEYLGKVYTDSYGSCSWPIYMRTAKGSDFSSKMPDLLEYFKSYYWVYQQGIDKEVDLLPLTECHFDTNMDGYQTTSRTFLSVLEMTMLVILFFAIINYINLSLAQSAFRAKEAATRRLLGSSRVGLFCGFIVESVLFCCAAALLALLLAIGIEPAFNQLLGAEIHVLEVVTLSHLAGGVFAIVLLGMFSGAIPARVISHYEPLEVVRGTLAHRGKMIYSRILITFQYCITIVLLGCTITIFSQTHYMRTAKLGFATENILWMNNTVTRAQLPALRDQLMQINGVEAVSFCAGDPITGGNWHTLYDSIKEQSCNLRMLIGDTAFMDLLGIEIISRTGVEEPHAMYFNETAVKELELSDTVTWLKFYPKDKIAGVVKDFHTFDLSTKIPPIVIRFFQEGYRDGNLWGQSPWVILVKISGTNPTEVNRKVQAVYSEYNGGIPFDSGFFDTTIDSWYDQQERTYTIIGAFAVIAILIAALGMLAMATYYLRQRTEEIAIRKVFGSTEGEVFRRVIANFLKMVLIALIIAVPIIWYAMDRWLSEYAYHISLSWVIFAGAGAIALTVALITVFWQSYRATRANPVDSLRK